MKTGMCLVGICAALGFSLAGCGSSASTQGFTGGDGTSADGGTSPTGSGPVAPDPTDPNATPTSRPPLAAGLTISEVALFQGVKVSLEKAGSATAALNAPIVAGRAGLLRVYVAPDASWSSHEVTAELRIESGTTKFPLILDTKAPTAASTEGNLATTFNFDVPGEQIVVGATFAVAIRDAATTTGGAAGAGATASAQYPAGDALAALPAQDGGKVVKIKIVPVQYNADGSGRVPDTSAAAIERYRAAVYAKYPAAKVEITVREPFPYAPAISATSGQAWSNVLQAIINLRLQDGAAKDVYYYGAFNPKATFNAFCGQGCILGLSGLIEDARDSSQRASVGAGYPGYEDTMPHEVGHAHGREHADCGGAQQIDPQFPYPNGGIGSWGYDLIAKKLVNPNVGTDMMGYCDNVWISDYTFKALFTRIAAVGSIPTASLRSDAKDVAPKAYRFLNVDAAGALTWGSSITLDAELFTQAHAMTYTDAAGKVVANVMGHYYSYGDIPGGYWLVPEGPSAAQKLSLSTTPAGVKMVREIASTR